MMIQSLLVDSLHKKVEGRKPQTEGLVMGLRTGYDVAYITKTYETVITLAPLTSLSTYPVPCGCG